MCARSRLWYCYSTAHHTDLSLQPSRSMEAEQRNNGMTLNGPLLLDEQQNHLNSEETPSDLGQARNGSASFLKTCLNGRNALSGVGLLSIPYALASGGWLSLILLFFIAMATLYTGALIKKCLDMNSDIRTYPDIGERAFGRKGKLAVSIAMYSELYLVATGMIILIGDNLNYIFLDIVIEIAGLSIGGKQFFVILTGLIIMPSVYLDDLSLLSYVSASGVFSSVIVIRFLLWIATVDGVGFHCSGTLINWSGMPTAVSLYAFCYCAHPVFPTLHNSIKNKSQFSNLLLICFVLSTTGYASRAIIGYVMFGSDVKSEVTLNLPVKKLTSKVAIICITVLSPL
ncbi:amino acid transporter AVT1I-like [Neltuma alba]|uniref:amino acid transporter AVT1I-like n=1 Tax=Neltuma alba TaxID=207710 RepID=UPI0010A39964|nr:amino acid transporter AVT1I-like [Prosopis alba]